MAKKNQKNHSKIENERDFHNKRIEDDSARAGLSKYYWSAAPFKKKYEDKIHQNISGGSVVEVGSFHGNSLNALASRAEKAVGIDISDRAINKAKKNYSDPKYEFHVMNAENLEFKSGQFDLVFGSGIIHHLDLNRSIPEFHRVLKPGGKMIFIEPMGHNPLINHFRNKTPQARTVDEHPLMENDLKNIEHEFSSMSVEYYGLTVIGAAFLHGLPGSTAIRNGLNLVDKLILLFPPLKKHAWQCMIEATK